MNNLALSLTGSAAAGALTLISPSDWSPGVRRAYVLVPGALVAAGGALVLFQHTGEEEPTGPGSEPGPGPGAGPEGAFGSGQPLPVAPRMALLLGLGAATCGVQAASLRIDTVIERWLTRRGAVHPRRWMAALVVLATLGTDAAGSGAGARARRGRRTDS